MTGKWHLGHTPELLPFARGSTELLPWLIPARITGNRGPICRSTIKLIGMLTETSIRSQMIFTLQSILLIRLLNLLPRTKVMTNLSLPTSLSAVHMPVQAPKEFSDKYKGVYDAGWTVMRERRHLAAEEAGVVPEGTRRSVTPGTLEWGGLSEEQNSIMLDGWKFMREWLTQWILISGD